MAGRAFHVMTKPIGPICNLDCRYCYYLEKEGLYQGERRWQMSDELLESYIRSYIAEQTAPVINFAWQGGEPTLLGIRFFRRVIELQQKHGGGKKILNSLQTNGTLLDEEWGAFLQQHDFLVGISIDGPQELHDAYRLDKQGKPTWERVMHGIAILKRYQVEFNTLTVVNRLNSTRPLEVYRFLKAVGSGHIQFIPLVERLAGSEQPSGPSLAGPPSIRPDRNEKVTDWSVRSEQFGRFLVEIYDEWIRNDVGRIFVQQFEAALGSWYGSGPGICVYSPTCGDALAMEHNGDVYSCDHYVYPEFRLGNIRDSSLSDMATSERQKSFGKDKRDQLPAFCRKCDVLFACNGECPKHRFLTTPQGEPGLSYLCAGHKHFFRHVRPTMEMMVRLLHQKKSPALVMNQLQPVTARVKPGRNDACPCGSGRKFKACCGS